MKRVLLTGLSGVGKSTVAGELRRRGYKAIDMDEAEWSMENADGDWVWREDRVEELMSTADADVLFVCGCDDAQRKLYRCFDHIVLLSAPRDVMVDRIATRTNNPFGKRPEELAQILDDLDVVEPILRNLASSEVDTSGPVDDVVAEVLRCVLA